MIDRDKVFDAFRNCITEPKCKDCPWEQCEQFNQKKVDIPVTLALDVIELLKEQETEYVYDEYATPTCKECGFHPFAGYIPTIKWMRERGYKVCPGGGRQVKWDG